uniref:DUF6598 domain-containing protein n=1 Tax=Setaria italica TaxID=4555 RepID=K3YMA1_SETIT
TGGYLRLLSPRRGMSMKINCLIEVDIRVKAIGDDDTKDKTLADGCMQFMEDKVYFDALSTSTISGRYGSYDFTGKNCECDSFVRSTGRFPQYFVASVEMNDYFLVDIAEGKSPLIFKPTIHGSEEKEYSFDNGALVSVKVSWSTAYY